MAAEDLRPGRLAGMLRGLAQRGPLVLAVFFMAISFFAFMKLLSVADLSFAVPVTAASVALETVLARLVLREKVTALRWAGALSVACGVALLGNVTAQRSSSLQAPPALYQLLAIVAVLCHRRQPPTPNPQDLAVSILKPVYGKDAGFYEAIRTHALQQYPEFEILFGIRRADDPARVEVERLMRRVPRPAHPAGVVHHVRSQFESRIADRSRPGGPPPDTDRQRQRHQRAARATSAT